MSPRKKKTSEQSIHRMAAEWLNSNTQSIAEAVTARTFARHPELNKKYGARGRAKCLEDAAYHLHYLSEALANNSSKMFVNYVGWAKIMLRSRGIDPQDLRDNLDAMSQVVARKCPLDCKKIFAQFIKTASTQLPKLPDDLPTFIDPSTNPLAEIADAYLRSLLLLHREEAISQILHRIELGLTIREIFRFVIAPAQQEVGRLWQENRINVVQEHYCSAATDLLISRIKRRFVGVPRTVTAVALCPGDEEHSIGLKMFSDLLESEGWTVAYLGAKCPIADAIKHIRAHATDLVAISVATPLNLTKAKELIQGVRSLDQEPAPLIMVGGAAINSNPEIERNLDVDGLAVDVSEGVEIANRLVANRKPTTVRAS